MSVSLKGHVVAVVIYAFSAGSHSLRGPGVAGSQYFVICTKYEEPLVGSMVERGLYERVVLGSKPGQMLISW